MIETQLNDYHDTLVALRGRLAKVRCRGTDEVADKARGRGDLSDVPAHPADRDVAFDESRRQMIAQIDIALERVQEGNYGRCVRCGGEIEATRLFILPFALRCITCEEQEEREREAETW